MNMVVSCTFLMIPLHRNGVRNFIKYAEDRLPRGSSERADMEGAG